LRDCACYVIERLRRHRRVSNGDVPATSPFLSRAAEGCVDWLVASAIFDKPDRRDRIAELRALLER
jgi:hypothetical protein